MANLIILLALISLIAIPIHSYGSDCPVSSQVTGCAPKCLQDSECSSIGGKCCPNLCNARSCVQSNRLSNSGSGSKGSSNSATGSYCGNVKCSSFEKCDMDRSTKKMKCVRT